MYMAELEEATTANVPFVGAEVDLTNPTGFVVAAVSLIFGFAIFSMTESIGEQVGSSANALLSNILGRNVGGEDTESIPGV